jgi:hypothetical protein
MMPVYVTAPAIMATSWSWMLSKVNNQFLLTHNRHRWW